MVQLTALTTEVLAAILKSIDEGIHVVNTEGETIFYNEVASKHDGMAVDEVLGKPLLEVFPSLTADSSTLLKVIKTKKPIYNQAQVYLNVHGKRIDTINTTLPIFLNNNIIGAVEIAKDYSRMKVLAESLLDLQKSLRSKREKKAANRTIYTLEDIKTTNTQFLLLKAEAKKFAKSDSPIIVYGESGTGKELFVQGIHHESRRVHGPFIAQNCAAIPETLLESMLFGTSRGSYTGAVDRIGLFEFADGGTLFLDELHAMPIELQAKLLRVLEDGMVRRVGSTDHIYVDVRLIVAMNEHPGTALKNQKLRSDLYYRLNVFMFSLLPLRDRKEDIPLLTDYFISYYNKEVSKSIQGIDKELEAFFMEYPWPGNVRELKHTIEYMVNVSEDLQLSRKDLPVMLKHFLEQQNIKASSGSGALSLIRNIKDLEKVLIADALNLTNGNIKRAAELLEIPRQTLQYKIKKMIDS